MPHAREFSALFDLDGVLLDTEGIYSRATQAVVDRFGKTYGWDLKRHTMGRDERLGARFVIERLELPLTVDEFLNEREPILVSFLREAEPLEGAEAFVRQLSVQGTPIAVATSSNRALFDVKTARHEWFELFDAVVCGDDPRVSAKKPHPDIFLVAAKDLGVRPAECLVFEDSPAGVEAGHRAGMRVIALPDPAMDLADYDRAHHVVANRWRGVEALARTEGWTTSGQPEPL